MTRSLVDAKAVYSISATSAWPLHLPEPDHATTPACLRTVAIHHTVPAVIHRTRQVRHSDVLTLNHTVAQFLSTG